MTYNNGRTLGILSFGFGFLGGLLFYSITGWIMLFIGLILGFFVKLRD
jgi:hypothetical protein